MAKKIYYYMEPTVQQLFVQLALNHGVPKDQIANRYRKLGQELIGRAKDESNNAAILQLNVVHNKPVHDVDLNNFINMVSFSIEEIYSLQEKERWMKAARLPVDALNADQASYSALTLIREFLTP